MKCYPKLSAELRAPFEVETLTRCGSNRWVTNFQPDDPWISGEAYITLGVLKREGKVTSIPRFDGVPISAYHADVYGFYLAQVL